MRPIDAAAAYWAAGDKAMANLRLAVSRLPTLGSAADADRLTAAAWCLDQGLTPRELMAALGLDPAGLDLRKYDPDQPRVSAGSGRERRYSMIKIKLDGSKWRNIDDFYTELLQAPGAPPDHGRGIDALIDSIIGGGMNAIEPPYAIIITGTESIDKTIRQHIETAKLTLAEVRAQVRADRHKDIDATINILG